MRYRLSGLGASAYTPVSNMRYRLSGLGAPAYTPVWNRRYRLGGLGAPAYEHLPTHLCGIGDAEYTFQRNIKLILKYWVPVS